MGKRVWFGRLGSGEVSIPPNLQRFTRFSIVGIGTTVLYFLLTNLFVVGVGLAPMTASICAYLAALGLSYVLQSAFAFRITPHSVERVSRFAVVSAVGLFISYTVMWLASDVLEVGYFFGAIAVSVIIPVVNFVAFSRWVFSRRLASSEDRIE